MLNIKSYVLGPAQTNAYLISDENTGEVVVIDPAWNGEFLASEAGKMGSHIIEIWLTHAHFDHIGGIAAIVGEVSPDLPIGLHPLDRELYEFQGGAPFFGMKLDPAPAPTMDFQHGQQLNVGSFGFEVRHAPGHTLGHVIFYCRSERLAFSGDVIFRESIGRTDLPGGDYKTLITSINKQVLSLPDETRLYTGHGPETNVGLERISNPFLVD